MFAASADDRYFTLQRYRSLVLEAQALGYRITTFAEFAVPAAQPVLLMRHDLDGPLGGAQQMAELEASLGIRSTYFVQTASDFYNLLSKSSRSLIRRIAGLGHEIGLHYEAARYVDEGEAALRNDLRLLEDLAGRPIRSASQHLPVDSKFVDVSRHVEHDAYAPRYTQPPMHYLSDSLMTWRQATPYELLARRASFQLLTHPETWCGNFRHMGEALDAMMQEELGEVHERYERTRRYYAELLATRAERDRRFVERQAQFRQPVRAGDE